MPTAERPPADRAAQYDAVILAGGRARRLGGADKPGMLVGGRPLIAWVAGAVAGAGRIIIVGPPRPELPDAIAVREDPPGSGPVPALRTGLAEVRAPWVALLAADLPFLRAAHVMDLLDVARGQGRGAVLVDEDGREQWLAGAWRAEALRAALARYAGASLRGLLGPLRPETVGSTERRPPWYDCDTPAEFEAATGP